MLKRIAKTVLLLCLAAGVLANTPAPSLPDTAPGHLLSAWLKYFNSGDKQAMADFIREHYSERERQGTPPERMAEMEMGFRERSGGGLELLKIEKSEPDVLTAILRDKLEIPSFNRVVFQVDPAKPDVIAESKWRPVPPPAEFLSPRVDAATLAKELDAKLAKMAAKNQFSGAVLISRDGKPLWEKAYGLADREAKTPNTLETRFRLGSMPKMFTSVAIAQLVERGKLKYTDTVADVLPDYPNKEVAKKVTVHQLLTHTSGLGNIFGPKFEAQKDSLRTVKDYLHLFADEPLKFEPGTSWSYSNAGFIVLGVMVEKLSGQSYYDYIEKNILGPAGMKNTGNTPKTQKTPLVAVGYTREPGRGEVPNFDTLPWRGMSAGGGESTVGDMLRFSEALRSGKLLNPELTRTVVTSKADTPFGGKYAYGFADTTRGGKRAVGHGGGAPGMNGQLDIYWDDGYTVVVLANQDPPAAERVARYIGERLK